MTRTIRAAAYTAAALFGAHAAAAQERPVISLAPAEPARWDLAGHVGWLGSNKSDIGADWNDWYNAASAGVTAGYYFTPHFKTEVQTAISRQGRIYSLELIPNPGGAFPISRSHEHFFGASAFSAGVSRQFFENQWFHPFVGGGLEIVRETHRIDTAQQFIPVTGTTEVSWAARPYLATGFKWYMAERGFVRSELRTSFSQRGPEHVVWATGLGVDF